MYRISSAAGSGSRFDGWSSDGGAVVLLPLGTRLGAHCPRKQNCTLMYVYMYSLAIHIRLLLERSRGDLEITRAI